MAFRLQPGAGRFRVCFQLWLHTIKNSRLERAQQHVTHFVGQGCAVWRTVFFPLYTRALKLVHLIFKSNGQIVAKKGKITNIYILISEMQ